MIWTVDARITIAFSPSFGVRYSTGVKWSAAHGIGRRGYCLVPGKWKRWHNTAVRSVAPLYHCTTRYPGSWGSLNHIIEASDTTKGALFHHFTGKDELGYAVLEEIIEPHMRELWFDPFAKSDDPIADIKRTVQSCTAKCRQSGVLEKGCPLNN